MQYTNKMKLNVPILSDLADITKISENFTTIDNYLRSSCCDIVIASYNTSDKAKKVADYVCASENAQTTINSAIASLTSTGGKIVLLSGTYNLGADILINKDNVTIEGLGSSTVLNAKSVVGDASCVVMFSSADNAKLKNLKVNINQNYELDKIFVFSSSLNNSIENIDIVQEISTGILDIAKVSGSCEPIKIKDCYFDLTDTPNIFSSVSPSSYLPIVVDNYSKKKISVKTSETADTTYIKNNVNIF